MSSLTWTPEVGGCAPSCVSHLVPTISNFTTSQSRQDSPERDLVAVDCWDCFFGGGGPEAQETGKEWDTQVFERFEEYATPMQEAASSLEQHALSFGNGGPRQPGERAFQDLDHVSINAHAGGFHSVFTPKLSHPWVFFSLLTGGFSPTSTARSRSASRIMSRGACVALRKWCAKAT